MSTKLLWRTPEEKLKHKDTSLNDRNFHGVEINSHDVTTNIRKNFMEGKLKDNYISLKDVNQNPKENSMEGKIKDKDTSLKDINYEIKKLH